MDKVKIHMHIKYKTELVHKKGYVMSFMGNLMEETYCVFIFIEVSHMTVAGAIICQAAQFNNNFHKILT
jgi:hypothetical protein